jgi:hypothetical protein
VAPRLAGGLVLSLSFILPLIGTFLLMPWAFVSGFGAFILSMRTPRSTGPFSRE